ncbi:DUF2497 domain-containing protein [Ancylobacter sp. G4_0304]|uniref:DUF2497 domain-containing protein n=1 Tax=Ancylobacter sp. G4_0304 TaxID=3114289 RepID=UPI0039C66C3C
MEEILASIRRIISDDVAADAASSRAPEPTAPAVEAAEAPSREAEPARPVVSEPRAPEARISQDRASEPRAFARPLVAPAPRAAAGYTPAAARRPLADPYAPRSYGVSRAAPEPAPQANAEPAVDELDLDAPFAAALMDLALVEQAVQAELAAVPAELFQPAAIPAVDEAPASDAAVAETSAPAGVALDAAVQDEHDSPVAASWAAATSAEPAPAPAETAPPVPEAVDMQVQAKPAPLSPRSPASPAASVEARPVPPVRAPESAAELPRPERLVSAPTNSAVAASFGSLARTVASNSRSVEDVVTEAIRPMLKSWLDENLPALVERLVRAEIERVARQG